MRTFSPPSVQGPLRAARTARVDGGFAAIIELARSARHALALRLGVRPPRHVVAAKVADSDSIMQSPCL